MRMGRTGGKQCTPNLFPADDKQSRGERKPNSRKKHSEGNECRMGSSTSSACIHTYAQIEKDTINHLDIYLHTSAGRNGSLGPFYLSLSIYTY